MTRQQHGKLGATASADLNPLAQALNTRLEAVAPEVLAMLSGLGRRLYFPKGILSQSAEASKKAKRFNATIGIATEGHEPMHLASICGAPPLVVVPKIWTVADTRRKWTIRIFVGTVLVTISVGAVLAVHHFVMPLDVILAVAERNFESFISSIRGD